MQPAWRIAADVTAGRLAASAVLAEHAARHAATHARLNALVQPRTAAAAAEAAALADCGTSLPPQDAATTDRRKPRLFARSVKWPKVRDDFGHGKQDRSAAGGLLAGVPMSVKDCFAVAGLRTTLGLESRRGAVDSADAPLVAALRAAGAIVVGKANVPQAMMIHETDNRVWGRTRHPLDGSRSPGGSSGGDAALVAAGVVPLAVGNDLAGSLRQPAHACGIATLMPTSATLGEGGACDLVPHLTAFRPRAGFLATGVADLALALRAATRSGDEPAPGRPATGLRVGWWDSSGPIAASPAVVRAVTEAVARLDRAGVRTVRLPGDLAEEAAWLHGAILSACVAADLRAALVGSRPIAGVRRLLRVAALPRAVRPAVAAIIRLAGCRLEARALAATGPRSAAGVGELLAMRADLAARFAALTAGCDAVVCPVSALPALRHGTAARLFLAAAPCLLANLLDLPAGAVPVTTVRADEETGREPSRDPVLRAAADCDRGSRGLPVGVQVIGCPGHDEATVLAVMAVIETA